MASQIASAAPTGGLGPLETAPADAYLTGMAATNTAHTVTASNGQVFDVIQPENMPRDTHGDGSGLRYTTLEHDEMMCPQALEVMDESARWAIYEPLPNPPPEKRPQDQIDSAASLRITAAAVVRPRQTHKHDKLRVPWLLKVTDDEGRSAVYQPLKMEGEVVRARRPENYVQTSRTRR